MKKTILLILIMVSFYSFAEDSSFTIDKQWVRIKKRQRVYHDTRNLIELDKLTLEELENNSISENAEEPLSELMHSIITYNMLKNINTSIKAFDILQKKFKEKKHFYDVASEFAYLNSKGNPFIIAKIIKGLSELLDNDYYNNIHTLKVVYQSIEYHYINKAVKGGEVLYGTDTVVIHLIEYLRKFSQKVQSDKIKIDGENMKIIAAIYKDLDLENPQSNFIRLPGAEDLKREYFQMNDVISTSTKNKKENK